MKHFPFSFSGVGCSLQYLCDNTKEMILDEFDRKFKEASCHLTQTVPFSRCLSVAEREINELTKGSGRKLIKSGTPKRLWDDCKELESYTRLNTAHSIYKLDGEVPETIMSGEMSDISQSCELEWFDWVMFQDKMALYPDDHLKWGDTWT